MSRGVQAFKQGDVAKALKAARIAGVTVDRYEIDKAGKIVVFVGKAEVVSEIAGVESREDDPAATNEWDAVK